MSIEHNQAEPNNFVVIDGRMVAERKKQVETEDGVDNALPWMAQTGYKKLDKVSIGAALRIAAFLEIQLEDMLPDPIDLARSRQYIADVLTAQNRLTNPTAIAISPSALPEDAILMVYPRKRGSF